MEGIVHVQVDPEEGLVGHRVEIAVELLVVFVLQFAGFLCPKRGGVVDDVVLGSIHLLAIFPFFLLTESHGDRKEAAILLQQGGDTAFLEEFLAVIVDVEDDVRAAVSLVCLFQGELRAAVACPFDCLGILPVGFGDDFHLLCHHEGGVETQTKVTDDGVGVVFVFFQEVVCT